jgi:hypothetical protein
LGATAGQNDAAQQQLIDSRFSQALAAIGLPAMSSALGDLTGDLGAPGSGSDMVKKAFTDASTLTSSEFKQQEAAAPLTLTQVMKQSGNKFATGAASSGSDSIIATLEANRRGALRGLQEQESDALLSQRDFDLANILGISQGGVSNAFSFGRDILAADQYDTANPGGGALSGALAGASLGTEINPGWGTLIGGVVGAAGGYFAGGG